jgi:alkanesulfonate monooxygenase SsuD/methylene tetrahydromethanopterin reductase-like flavin-dependent oxidoreductase (luciferase family)
MRIAMMIEGQEGVTWEQWIALAQAAEAAELDGLFRSDHYRAIHRGPPAGALDAWITLGALAACTHRLRLGTLVSPVTFRQAAVLGKSAVTVDLISAGRVELGIGTGWFEAEHEAYGLPFMTAKERFDELERQLANLERQWTSDEIWPKPVQRPHPPIIVGGRARPRSVAAAARYADEYNTVAPTVEQARERCQIVRAATRAAGREPLTFSIMVTAVLGRDEAEAADRERIWLESTSATVTPQLVGTVERVAQALREYASAGVERAMVQHLVHEDLEMVPLLGELAKALEG